MAILVALFVSNHDRLVTIFMCLFQDQISYFITGDQRCKQYFYVDPLNGELQVREVLSAIDRDSLSVSMRHHN